MPLRVTISPRNLDKDSVEIKWRHEKKAQLLPLERIARALKEMVANRS
jgi:hypothetical protein